MQLSLQNNQVLIFGWFNYQKIATQALNTKYLFIYLFIILYCFRVFFGFVRRKNVPSIASLYCYCCSRYVVIDIAYLILVLSSQQSNQASTSEQLHINFRLISFFFCFLLTLIQRTLSIVLVKVTELNSIFFFFQSDRLLLLFNAIFFSNSYY